MEWIAGDIGGTKSWLAWVTGDARRVRFERVYPSGDFVSASALLLRFMADAGAAAPPDGLVLALAGPSLAQRVELTNLDWTVDAAELRELLGVDEIRLVNDFEAAAAGIATLTDADLVALNPRTPEPMGVRAITGAGTGLGLAFLLRDDSGLERAYPTEGGHADFGPGNAEQARLLEYLRGRYGHVSWERVVSGSALPDLYAFCCAERGVEPREPVCGGPCLADGAAAGDVAADAALALFTDLYGAWVGNVALLYRPRGGLYIAGGVSAHLRARLQAPRFMAAATAKGRMRGVVESTPIFLVTSHRLGVQGALAMAEAVSRARHERRAVQS